MKPFTTLFLFLPSFCIAITAMAIEDDKKEPTQKAESSKPKGGQQDNSDTHEILVKVNRDKFHIIKGGKKPSSSKIFNQQTG